MKILSVALENCQKSALKCSIGKPILLNFVIFSREFLSKIVGSPKKIILLKATNLSI